MTTPSMVSQAAFVHHPTNVPSDLYHTNIASLATALARLRLTVLDRLLAGALGLFVGHVRDHLARDVLARQPLAAVAAEPVGRRVSRGHRGVVRTDLDGAVQQRDRGGQRAGAG